jgi:hypothetical protein
MYQRFTSNEVPLAQLLDQVASGSLQLPDFQRGWVWDDSAIRSLLASISLSYPIGAVMTLQTGNPDVKFKPRLIQGTPEVVADPELLLLDGQQRMTSLFLVLRSGKAVPTRDQRGAAMSRHYYVDIDASLNPVADREDAIISVPESRVVKAFGSKETLLDLSTVDHEVAGGKFPLRVVMDSSETMAWQLKYLSEGPGDYQERLKTWIRFNEAVVNAFVQYQVPTIQLVKATPKEAVCQVFEKVNTGGVSLTVFELLTAQYAADDFKLRYEWDRIQARLAKHAVLEQIGATSFLQTVTLLATNARRESELEANGAVSETPVSCKRRDVLRLPLEEFVKWAEPATAAYQKIAPLLHEEHVFTARDLPYASQLVPLAAILARLGPSASNFGCREKLRRWLWCGVFGELYGGATETRFAWDLQDVVAWVNGSGPTPRTVEEAQFQAARLLSLRTRQSAAYKGVHALQMKQGARDFRTGTTIDIHAYADDAIDIHHIFPQHWCAGRPEVLPYADSIVNKAPIDAYTNRMIGGNAPSGYLEKIQKEAGISSAELDAILRSHDIDPVPIRDDDFATFYRHRFERLTKAIEEAMGKPVNRASDDNPFMQSAPADPSTAIGALMSSGESKVLEFKSTGRVNLHTKVIDPGIEWSALKSLAAFANSYGGTLLLGVADDGEVCGLQPDFATVKGHDLDGWELWLTGAVANCMGKAFAAQVDVTFATLVGGVVARIDVGPSPKPVFAKKEGKEVFMVRTNNSTQELTGQAALDYQLSRWPA